MVTRVTKLSERHGGKIIEAFEPSQNSRRYRPNSNLLTKSKLNPHKQWLKFSLMEGSPFFIRLEQNLQTRFIYNRCISSKKRNTPINKYRLNL